MCPSVLTSNLSEEDFKSELGPRLIDRFKQSVYAALHLKETSKREASTQQYFERVVLR